VATFVQYAMSFVLAPVVLSKAGVGTFGAWATISSILAVGALADAGLKLEVSRRVAEAAGRGDDAAVHAAVHHGTTLLATIAGTATLAGVLLAPFIRAFAFPHGVPGIGATEADLLLRLTFVLLGCSLLADGYFAVLRGLQRGDVETNARMVGLVVGTATTVLGIELGWSLWALLAGAAVTDFTAIALQGLGTRRVIPGLRFRMVPLRSAVGRGMVALSGLALVSQISDVIDSQWDKVMLSRYVGSSAVAGFQIGSTLALQAKALAVLPAVPLVVVVAELRRRDPERARRILRVLGSATFVIGAVTLSALVVFAPPFLHLWLGRRLPSAVISARLFAIAIACNLFAAPLAYRALGESRHRLTAIASGANIGVNAILSYVLTVTIGLRGPLYGSIAGNAIGTALFFVLMRRALGPEWEAPSWRAPLVGVVAALAGVMVGTDRISSWPVLIVVAGGFAVAVGAVAARAERLPVRDLLRRRLEAVA
jgi:O-antigen/teichoic acid export membrane protein